MRRSKTYRASMVAAAGMTATAMMWTAGPAYAATATAVTTAGHNFKIANIGNITVSVAGLAGSCSALSATGTVPTTNNPNPSGPVSAPITDPLISGCTAPFETVTVTTSGAWTISAQYGSTITAALQIPANGVTVHASGLITCTATGGNVNLSGPATLGTNSTTNPTYIQASATVPISGCPFTTATISGKAGIYDTTDSTLPILVTS